jgi:transcriptional regulator with XRE-family HTH domain
MSTEDKLRYIIKERYGSVNNFAEVCGLPSSTVSSILYRGIGTATLSNIMTICKVLNINADDLATGNFGDEDDFKRIDIVDILAEAKQQLLFNKALMFNGKPADEESIQSILSAMEVGMEIARRKKE